MKIIKPGKAQELDLASPSDDAVPFVIAYDLLEEMESRLTEEEALAIGLALSALTTHTSHDTDSSWRLHARQEASCQTR